MENAKSKEEEMNCEMRPNGMLVQKRDNEDDANHLNTKMINISVSHGSSLHQISFPPNSTFGDLKRALVEKSGLEPVDQRLLFRGKEKEDDEHLQLAGVKDNSKLLLLENPAAKLKKLEDMKKRVEIDRACQAVAGVRADVDKLSEKVATLEVAVNSGNKVPEKEFLVNSEMLMRELLKLDNIEAEGEAKLQRKAEVCRIQSMVEALDTLKEKNSNPFNSSSSVSVSTKWETFDSGMGSLSAPSARPSSTKVTQDWEQFD